MFKISPAGTAITDHQVKKEISGLDARIQIQSKMKLAEYQMKDPFVSKRVNPADAKKNFDEAKRMWDRTCPETLTPDAQNIMWKRAKQLKDEFTVGILSQDELQPLKGIEVDGSMKYIVDWDRINTNRNVERNTEWYKRNSQKISEYKNIMRHLCPDNPMASDIERFRPRRKTV